MFNPFREIAVIQSGKRAKKALYFLPILILAGLLAGDKLEFWEKKNSSQWSQKECRKLLEDSPWVKHHVITSPWMETNQNSRSVAPPVVRYAVQLRSADPVRQAVERLSQLTGQPSGPSGPGGRGFGNAPGFGQPGFYNPVTVHVKCSSDSLMLDWSLFNYWTKQSVDGLKNFVSISTGKGAKVQLARYVSPYFFGTKNSKSINNEFEFVFPRRVDGREILGPDDEFLELEFPHPNLAANAQPGNLKGPYDPTRGRDDLIKGLSDFTRCAVKFKTDKMKFQGNIVY
jgi:hypothetical protein